jgi:glyoxylase-like metal-dependent hydrolase (beta-lactamase superfamily II)
LDVRLIDVRHLGRERVIGCFQVGDVLIDPGPTSCLPALLKALGDARPRTILLTHIHLDHAGASGSLVERWPDVEVYVHERGARHMADPSRLLESARRLYGEDMDRLWGDFVPVPESQLRVLKGGETLLDGNFEVAYTPGHASHHVSYLHEGTAFVGDVGGVRIPPSELTIPPTPPPDIDVGAWEHSLKLIGDWQPERLAITHFGEVHDVARQLEAVCARLEAWAEVVRDSDRETFLGLLEQEVHAATDAETARAYTQAAPPDQLYAGLERYWHKRREATEPQVRHGGAPLS